MKKAKTQTSKPDSDEMRGHYDFSRGVRGKYAARYAEGVTIVIGPQGEGSGRERGNGRSSRSQQKDTAKASASPKGRSSSR